MSVIRRWIAMGVVGFGVLGGGLALGGASALAAPEVPRVQDPTSVTGTSAVLNGKLNPSASGTAGYYFSYNVGTSCEGGLTTPPGGPVTGEGVIVHEHVEALEALTEYTFCVIATSPSPPEEARSASKRFVTAASKPLAGGESVQGLTPYAVTLEAQVNPENELSTCVFEYGKPTKVSEHSVPCAPPTVEGSGEATVKASLTGLEGNTSYEYRVVVANATGKVEGKDEAFKTLLAVNGGEPEVESESSSPSPFEAKVEAQVNPAYRETLCKFEYASAKSVVTEGKGTKVPCNPENLGSGGSVTGASANLTGLSPATTYSYRVVVENTTNKKAVDGKIESFSTPALVAPKIESYSNNPFSPFEANLEAKVNPEYQETKCEEFEYTTEAEAAKLAKHEGTKVPCSAEKLGSGGSPVGVTATVAGLSQNTSYSYHVVVTNATGEADLPIEKFTTRTARAPEVEAFQSIGVVTPFEATLGGYVEPEYQETSCEIEYDTKESVVENGTGEKAHCSKEKLGDGNSLIEVFATLTKLTPNTTYYFRFVATNASGTKRAPHIEQFTTETAQPPTIESEGTSEVTALHAKIEASINPDYQKTKVTFEYSSEGSAFFDGTATKVSGGTIPAGLGGGQGASIQLGAEVLQPGKTYYYRVIAENETSEKEGEPVEGNGIEHFTVSPAPVLTTAAAQNVAPGSVTLSGTVNPEGGEKTKYYYAYISQTSYAEALKFGGTLREINPTFNPYTGGSSTPEVEIEGTPKTVLVAQPVTLTGLTPGAEYHYALVATNSKLVGFNENNEPIYAVASTVISEGATFKVEGTLTKEESPEPPPAYPTGPLGAPAAITPIPLLTVPSVIFPGEVTSRKATNAEKLKSALKACKKKHPKSKRTTCEKQARKRYAAKPKKKKKK